jgi:hypothetical protein
MSPHWIYDEGVLVESTVDNGDGTGTKTTYNPDGTVDSVEALTDLPLSADSPDPLYQLVQAIVDATTFDDVKAAARAILGDGA